MQVDARSAYVRRVDKTPAAIRAALPVDVQSAFDTDFRTALATVADTFDMAPLDRVLRVWWTEALLCLNPEVHAEIDDTRRRIAAGGLKEAVARPASRGYRSLGCDDGRYPTTRT